MISADGSKVIELAARLHRARLKYIRLVLAGCESGDEYFQPLLAEIKAQWPDLVADEIHKRAHEG